jgi:transcriptional regulator with XRE-family HTH domain
MQNFSTRLAEAIAKSGKSKGALAASTGVALSTVSRWLGGTIPKAEAIARIAKFLGVDAKWLLSGDLSKHALDKLALAEMDELFSNPLFRNAWEAASREGSADHTKRLRRIVGESSSSYATRVSKSRDEIVSFFANLDLLCDLTSEEYPVDPGEDRNRLIRNRASLVSAASEKIYSELNEIILDCLALRDLAETSPSTLRILREVQNESAL